ncbi:hypothetical protein SMICM17S_12506 [Streptomyces microflavus]
MEALTRTWAVELGEYGIRVSAVAPGVIDGEALRRRSAASERHAAYMADLRRHVPLRRWCDERDVAEAVAFAADNPSVTGTVLEVDGGGLPARVLPAGRIARGDSTTRERGLRAGAFEGAGYAAAPAAHSTARPPRTADGNRTDAFMSAIAKHHGPRGPHLASGTSSGRSTAPSVRRLVRPEEIAAQVLFLLSDLSGGMTGQAVNVDAGAL